MQKRNPMGHEKILPLLIKMSLPVMLSMFIQSLYNIVDSYFVAQISEKALRAASLSYPIQIIIIAIGVGTGTGLNSLISRSLGANNQEKADQAAMHGLLAAILSSLLFIIFRFTLMDGYFDYFTKDPTVKAMGMEYLGLVSGFAIFSIVQITIEKAVQGTGKMVWSMIIQLLGAVINIILDPIMIFGLYGFPAMGIRGAAIATLIGQAAGALLGILLIFSKRSDLNINYLNFKFSTNIVKEIYDVGFPSIIMQSVHALVTTIMNLILIRHSEMAVSVLGVYFKLQSFVFMPVFGLSQGVLPLIGYNYGAENKERITEAFRWGMRLSALIMAVGTMLFQLFPNQLMNMFSNDPEMASMGVYTLRIISLSFVFAAIGITNSTFFQGLGLGKYSLIVTSLRQLILIIPIAYALSFLGLNFVWLAYPISEVIATIVSVMLQKRVKVEYVDIL
ncbi:MAG: MATE family efflux transporter [Tissierellia bacterium]|nr:MATE family efflux transporter [Tissierellia bacterium]